MDFRVSKKILVTGGADFIGSYLVGSLLVRGNEVAVLDNLSSGGLENPSKRLNKRNFRFVKGDLLNLDDCKVVFHSAANPEEGWFC
ncbi:MAG TPA: NAD-dependent epimerase/dehydratase family protein [Candidatus Bathyarchaeota archaeon]|nr:NAD-dependent epimerase/dehydratase family protein [Candidatus Bathyarchaeota archaeon]